MRALLLACLCLAGPARAQDAAARAPQKVRVLDRVLAIVGSQVVTESSIRPALDARILEERDRLRRKLPAGAAGPSIDPELVERWRRDLVRDKVKVIVFAERAKTLGTSPEDVRHLVDRLVRQELDRRQREAGGRAAFQRSLESRGISYRELEAERRSQLRWQLVYSTEFGKLREGASLAIRPSEMLAYFREHEGEFDIRTQADLVALSFDAGEAPETRDRVAKARARLVAGEDPALVAKALGADLHTDLVGLSPEGERPAFLRDFAFAEGRSVGAVSEPVARGTRVWLLELTRRVEGGKRAFGDPEVQRKIRDRLLQERWSRLDKRILFESILRVHVWPPDLFGR